MMQDKLKNLINIFSMYNWNKPGTMDTWVQYDINGFCKKEFNPIKFD